MKSLTNYINEKMVYNSETIYKVTPTSKEELIKIIRKEFENKNYDLTFIDTCKISDMSSIFVDIDKYTKDWDIELNISTWNTSNVTDISNLFSNVRKISKIDLTHWDVSNVKYMSSVFSVTNLKQVGDLSKWDLHNCKDIGAMFYMCSELESIGDISNWNVSKVIDTDFFLSGCHKIKSIGDISKWNVIRVNDFTEMFSNCHELKLDLRKFIKNVPEKYVDDIAKNSKNIIVK